LELVAGGGTYYGKGGLLVTDLQRRETRFTLLPRLLRSPGVPTGTPTVSGVCIDAEDRHVVASTWSRRHGYGPTHVFELARGELSHRATLDHAWSDRPDPPCPNGVALHEQHIVVRSNSTTLEDTYARIELPRDLELASAGVPQHLTSSHVAIVGRTLVTGAGGSLILGGWRTDTGYYEAGRAATGLILLERAQPVDKCHVLSVKACARVAAIAAGLASDTLITAGLNGEIDRWQCTGTWSQRRVQSPRIRAQPACAGDLVWATYRPASIVGLCYLADARRWLSVDASGEIGVWLDDERQATWQLPHPGSPRSIAAHPSEPWVAAAIKGPEPAIFLFNCEPFKR